MPKDYNRFSKTTSIDGLDPNVSPMNHPDPTGPLGEPGVPNKVEIPIQTEQTKPAVAPTPKQTKKPLWVEVTNCQKVNVRAEANTTSKPLEIAPSGKTFKTTLTPSELAKLAPDKFVPVDSNPTPGFIMRKFVKTASKEG